MTDAERLARFRANALHELKRGLLCIVDGLRDLRRPEVNHDIRAELQEMNPHLVLILLENMPKVAKPWVVLDMSEGDVTRCVRDTHGGQIAEVRRRTGWAARWAARVGDVSIPEPDDADWSTLDEAKAACDARLRELGVVLL